MLAAEVVTVDHLSGGRVECAVGAAWNEAEHRELGIPFPPVRERMDRLEEGVQVLQLLFTQDDVTFEGRQVRVEDATYRPRPVQPPHPPIWIGGTGRTRTLPMVGRHADAWHGQADDADELRARCDIIDAAADAAGRDPARSCAPRACRSASRGTRSSGRYEWMAAGGIGYLVVSWPSEGRGRVEEFFDQVMPTLGLRAARAAQAVSERRPRSSDRSVSADSASLRARRSRYRSTETSAENGAVMIVPIAVKIQRTTHAFPPIAPMIPPTMPVMSPATMITPTACQKCPFTRFHERLIASVPRRFSTISAGTATHKKTRKMRPGMTSRMKPPRTASPTSTETRITLPSRLKPYR